MSNQTDLQFGSTMVGLGIAAVLIAVIYLVTAATFQGDSSGPGSTVTLRDGGASTQVIRERIKPIGRVQVAGAAAEAAVAAPAGDAAAAPTVAAATSDAAGSAGEAIYKQSCFACHAAGVAGAPKLGDKAAWEARVAQGMDAMLTTAKNGKGAMPPKGTCATCSDEDLKAAIEYMVSQIP